MCWIRHEHLQKRWNVGHPSNMYTWFLLFYFKGAISDFHHCQIWGKCFILVFLKPGRSPVQPQLQKLHTKGMKDDQDECYCLLKLFCLTLNPRRYVTKTVTMSCFKGDSNQWLTCVRHRTLVKYASDSVFILTLFLTLCMNGLIKWKERSASVKPPCFDWHAVLCCILQQWRNWVLSLKCCLILLL